MVSRLWVPGPLPGLNELVEARFVRARKTGRGGKQWNAYSELKKKWEERIVVYAQAQRVPRIESAHFIYIIREPNRRRDPSNVAAAAQKLIEDGLQKCGVLENDGWKQVRGVSYFVLLADATHPPGVTLAFATPGENEDQTIAYWEGIDDEQINRVRAGSRRAEEDRAPARKAALAAGKGARPGLRPPGSGGIGQRITGLERLNDERYVALNRRIKEREYGKR